MNKKHYLKGWPLGQPVSCVFFTKIDQEKRTIEQICAWDPTTTDLLCKH